jgi:hypothetical protein
VGGDKCNLVDNIKVSKKLLPPSSIENVENGGIRFY